MTLHVFISLNKWGGQLFFCRQCNCTFMWRKCIPRHENTKSSVSEKIDLLCKKGSMHNLVAVFVMRQSLDEKCFFFKTHLKKSREFEYLNRIFLSSCYRTKHLSIYYHQFALRGITIQQLGKNWLVELVLSFDSKQESQTDLMLIWNIAKVFDNFQESTEGEREKLWCKLSLKKYGPSFTVWANHTVGGGGL